MAIDFENFNMPFSLDAEQAVLGCVLVDPACMPQVVIYLRPESFYLPQHRAIFAAMVSLETLGGKIDPLLVLDILKKDHVYDEEGGRNYLFQLAQSIPSTANVESYAKIVREKHYMRALITASQETMESAAGEEENADLLLDAAEQRIYSIRQGKISADPSRLSEVILNEVYEHLQKLTAENSEDYRGIPTGYSDLDAVISGLNKADLILLGARPSMGKTSVALNLARNAALLSGKKVLFFCLEMTKMQLAQRILFTEARVESSKMRSGELSPEDWANLGMAAEALVKCELYLDDSSSLTVPEIKARVRRLKHVDCVFVDYLGLLASETRSENRVQEVSKMTRALKMMAKDLNIPVFVCAQLSRGSESGGKTRRPHLADLRESGSLEQDADVVLMLYRENYNPGVREEEDDGEEPPRMDEMEIIVAKNRHGPTRTVKLTWNAEYTLLTQPEHYRDDYL